MTLAEKAALLNSLYKTAYDQQNHNSVSISPYFFTIDDQNSVFESTVCTNAVFNNSVYIIGCLRSCYNNYGYRNHYEIFVTIDSEGKPIGKIQGTSWLIEKIIFNEIGLGETPTSLVTFSRKSDPDNHIKLRFVEAKRFQQIWNFFTEIDANNYTADTVFMYHKYFEQKAGVIQLNKSMAEIEQQLNSKNSIIEQHQQLLEKIKNIVDYGDN